MRVALFGSLALTMMTPMVSGAETASVSGTYVEARTFQVYSGPCFANGEVGSSGKNAIMVWHFTDGAIGSVDIAGHSVAVIVKSSHTLGFHGLDDAESKKAIVVVDSSSDDATANALQAFAQEQTGLSAAEVARVENTTPNTPVETAPAPMTRPAPDVPISINPHHDVNLRQQCVKVMVAAQSIPRHFSPLN